MFLYFERERERAEEGLRGREKEREREREREREGILSSFHVQHTAQLGAQSHDHEIIT